MFKKRDPVCGKKVSKNTRYSLSCGGRQYYFDCKACKNTFAKNPRRFIPMQSGKGFLERLGEGSKEVPASCHEMKK